MLVDLSPGLALAPATEGHPATDANDASAGYVKPERCDKCGATLYPGEGMVAIGVLCNRCYQDDPYDEEPRRAKKAWVAPYTTKKAWGAASAARMRAVMQAPVLTAEGDPMPKGAKVTERDGYCWTCRQPVAAGRAEAIYNGSRRRQDAACPSCTWTSAYVMVMPTITREEALGIAKMRIPMGLLHNAGRAGYTTGEILDGILTPEVIAGLPVAIALASKS